MSTELLISIVLFAPLAGGIFAFLSGNKLADLVSNVFVLISLLFSVFLLIRVGEQAYPLRFEWFPGMEIGLNLDRISAALICLVNLISFLVHLFSVEYMRSDVSKSRYFGFLGFFTFSMLGLLMADHLILLFIFWELVGFSSYLLIGFWFAKEENALAARIAFIVNRIADAAFLSGILILWMYSGNAYLSDLQPVESGWITIAGFGLLIGAMGKSAQFPFLTWLPRAMAGPTPVSALIHAATMVAAGVYLLVRIFPVLDPLVLDTAVVVGCVTALIGAFSALAQWDIKSVLAYSTISQLGYMVMGIGAGAYDMGLFHLWTHAFFKAGLFLSVGAVIHFMHQNKEIDAQDMRNMGGLRRFLPLVFVAYTICMLALAGLPLFSGFLSKEGILIAVFNWGFQSGGWRLAIPVLGVIAAFMTAFYMARQWMLVFFGKPRTDLVKEKGNWVVTVPLAVLALGSFGFIYSLNPFGHEFGLVTYLFPGKLTNLVAGNGMLVLGLSLLTAFGGLGLGYAVNRPGTSVYQTLFEPVRGWKKWSFNALGIDHFYMNVLRPLADWKAKQIGSIDRKVIDFGIDKLGVGTILFSKAIDLFDKLVIDGLVNLAAVISQFFAGVFRLFHASRVQMHIVWATLGVIFLILWIKLA